MVPDVAKPLIAEMEGIDCGSSSSPNSPLTMKTSVVSLCFKTAFGGRSDVRSFFSSKVNS